MQFTQSRLAVSLLSVVTVLVGSGAITQATPQRLQVQRNQTPQRTIIAEPVQTAIPHATHLAPQIPPRPEMCVPDYSWFDYENWEWICVGHL